MNFRLPLKLPEVMRKSTFIVKKSKYSHLDSESLSELKKVETEVSLKEYLKKYLREYLRGNDL